MLFTTDKVADNTVTTDKLASNAVTTDKIKDGTILNQDIKPGEIPLGVLKSRVVTNFKNLAAGESNQVVASCLPTETLTGGVGQTNTLPDRIIITSSVPTADGISLGR